MKLLNRALLIPLRAERVIMKRSSFRNLLHLRLEAATLAVFVEISSLEKERNLQLY